MRTIATLLVMGLFLAGCSGGGGTEPPPAQPPTAAQLVSQGWQAFALLNYQAAADKFASAIQTDPSFVDAYNGAGWSNARLNRIDTAIAKFSLGEALDTNIIDIHAGLAVTYNARKLYLASANEALSALQKNLTWMFGRDTTVNSADLGIILAEDYFALSRFAESLSIVKMLDPAFSADVATVEGQTALAQEIERLRNALS